MTKKKIPLGLRNKRVSTMFRLLFSKAVTVGVPKNVSETEFFSYMNEKCNLQRSGFKKWTARPKKERLSVFQKMRLSGVAGILLFSSVALMVLLAAYSAYFVTFMQDSPEFVFLGQFRRYFSRYSHCNVSGFYLRRKDARRYRKVAS